ncbi:DUF5686 and carboxypeptidase regulatory-like domain-containing protein [Lacinutrix iliipiscaria]|uniref:DUF5686 and carboxypeptidase regulatory-like domain-containing protein n=1 Tax=Lacinutrix iliipiscaria TaxID=1230532 RepID=A0ABW5WNL4_9FLAO
MKHKLLLTVFLISSLFSYAQIIGTVTSTKSEPLAFVNIYIEGTYTGTTSNDNGRYELNITQPGTYTVTFKYLGFKTLKKTAEISKFPFTLDASLEENKISLDEVTVNAEENPADIIMRKAIANREKNLGKIKNYTADFYSRGFIKIENVPEKIFGQEVGDLDGNLDSTRSGMIYLSETISKIKYSYPDQLSEHIIASKISGNDSGFSFNTAVSADFNFYQNTIELGNQIVSPIANYAFNYYRFKLEGIFYDDNGNLINQIKVIPKREHDRIFSGTVYIVEDDWSFYALELDITGEQAQIPATELISIKQSFSYSEQDKLWSLMSQSIDFEYGFIGITGNGRFHAVYSEYDFTPEFSKDAFTNEILTFEKEANKKDAIFWDTKRPVLLTEEEATDYVKKDSVQTVRKSKKYLDSTDVVSNKFTLGNLLGYNYQNSYNDWNIGYGSPLEKIGFNTVQGFNTGMNFYYSKNIDDFNRYYRINADIEYGFSDERFRSTLSFRYKFNDIKRPFLTLSGGVKTQQFNANDPISKAENSGFSLFSERNYLKIYEKSFAQIGYSQEVVNGLRMNASMAYERRQPLFNTTDQVWYPKADRAYTSNNPLDETAYGIAPFETHHMLKFILGAQINFGQKYFSYPDSKWNIPNRKFPTLYLGYEKGFASSVSDYNFNEVSARLSQGLSLGNKGYFQYNLKGGTFFDSDNIAFTDYKHFNGNQINVGTADSYTNVFNNLPYYAFSTNKSYSEFHAEHDFRGYILGKIPLLNKLNFNLVVGAHNLSTQDRKPYQEYSIGLDNLGWGTFRFLRLDYVRSYQSGFVNDAIIFGIKLLN